MRSNLLKTTAVVLALSFPLAATAQQEQQLAQTPDMITQMQEQLNQGGDQAFSQVEQGLNDLKSEMSSAQPPQDMQQQFQEAQSQIDTAIQAVQNQNAEEARTALDELGRMVNVIVDVDSEGGQQQAQNEGQESDQASRIVIQDTQPVIDVQQQQPRVSVTQQDPVVRVEVPPPQITVTQPKPQVDVQVTVPEPQIEVTQADPKVTVEQQQPQVDVQVPEPQVSVQQVQPQVQVQQAQPTVDVEQQQPQVQVTQGEPQVDVQQGDPEVTVNRAEGEDNADVNVNVRTAQDGQQQSDQQQIAVVDEEQPETTQQNADTARPPAGDQDQTAVVAVVPTPGDGTSFGSYTRVPEADRGGIQIGNDFQAESLIGQMVYGANGEQIGEIGDLLVGGDNSVKQAIVEIGGFLGLGERPVAVDLSRLTSGDNGNLTLDISEEEAEQLPTYDERDGNWFSAG